MALLFRLLIAFLIGGAFCAVGQLFIDCTNWTPARILVTYVVFGVVLTAIGIYAPLVRFAGAGATVPLTGFGYCLADGVKEAVDDFGFLGALSGGLTATAAGITTAMTSGYLMALFCRSGDKS